jgi:hypothetical protein
MEPYAEAKRIEETIAESRNQVDQYYCVEFAIAGLEAAYQFKIWNKTSTYMSILVKDNSDILPQLKVGDTLNMLYYSDDLAHPTDFLETAIRRIARNDKGRLKGHYLVGLELLNN